MPPRSPSSTPVHEAPSVEATVDGAQTKIWRLEASDCPLLKRMRISHLGLDDAAPPYRRVRLRPSGSFVLACVSGEGRIWLEGRWQRVLPDMVCMAPPRVLNAFYAVEKRRWHMAWIRYEEPPELRALIGSTSPVLSRTGGVALTQAIEGLRMEWEAQRDPQVLNAWLEVYGQLAGRLSQPWRGHDRLRELWEEVECNPAAPWSLPELARRVHISEEYLRRLCLKELGRTPVQHLTYIRMQRAQHLLETTNDKLESIAAETGYDGAMVFSRAFKRCLGVTPSGYRARRP